ncbi:MAG: hypothetical protein ACP5KU_07740 [Candidatus Bathyarchaeia archaeon]
MPDLIAIGHVLMDIRIFVDEFPKADEEAKTDRLSLGGGAPLQIISIRFE